MKSLIVLSAGLSTPSTTRMLAEHIAGAVESQVTRRGEGLGVEYVEIRDYAQDLAGLMATQVPTERLRAVQEQVSAADALVAATPVFSASYAGLFKMFFDAMGTDSLNGMPVLIAATAGTPRHQLVLDFALRPLFTYLRAVVMPTGVFAATEDFGADSEEASFGTRVERAASELAGYIVRTAGEVAGLGPSAFPGQGNTSRSAGAAQPRDAGTRVQPGGVDFTSLLRGHTGEE